MNQELWQSITPKFGAKKPLFQRCLFVAHGTSNDPLMQQWYLLPRRRPSSPSTSPSQPPSQGEGKVKGKLMMPMMMCIKMIEAHEHDPNTSAKQGTCRCCIWFSTSCCLSSLRSSSIRESSSRSSQTPHSFLFCAWNTYQLEILELSPGLQSSHLTHQHIDFALKSFHFQNLICSWDFHVWDVWDFRHTYVLIRCNEKSNICVSCNNKQQNTEMPCAQTFEHPHAFAFNSSSFALTASPLAFNNSTKVLLQRHPKHGVKGVESKQARAQCRLCQNVKGAKQMTMEWESLVTSASIPQLCSCLFSRAIYIYIYTYEYKKKNACLERGQACFWRFSLASFLFCLKNFRWEYGNKNHLQ